MSRRYKKTKKSALKIATKSVAPKVQPDIKDMLVRTLRRNGATEAEIEAIFSPENVFGMLPKQEMIAAKNLCVVNPEQFFDFSDSDKQKVLENTKSDVPVIHSVSVVKRKHIFKVHKQIFLEDDGRMYSPIHACRYRGVVHISSGRNRLIGFILTGVVTAETLVPVLVYDVDSKAKISRLVVEANDCRSSGTQERSVANVSWYCERSRKERPEECEDGIIPMFGLTPSKWLRLSVTSRFSAISMDACNLPQVTFPFRIDDGFQYTANLVSFRNLNPSGIIFCSWVLKHKSRAGEVLERSAIPQFVTFISGLYEKSKALGKETQFFELVRAGNNEGLKIISAIVSNLLYGEGIEYSEVDFQERVNPIVDNILTLLGDGSCTSGEVMRAKLALLLTDNVEAAEKLLLDIFMPETAAKALAEMKNVTVKKVA